MTVTVRKEVTALSPQTDSGCGYRISAVSVTHRRSLSLNNFIEIYPGKTRHVSSWQSGNNLISARVAGYGRAACRFHGDALRQLIRSPICNRTAPHHAYYRDNRHQRHSDAFNETINVTRSCGAGTKSGFARCLKAERDRNANLLHNVSGNDCLRYRMTFRAFVGLRKCVRAEGSRTNTVIPAGMKKPHARTLVFERQPRVRSDKPDEQQTRLNKIILRL